MGADSRGGARGVELRGLRAENATKPPTSQVPGARRPPRPPSLEMAGINFEATTVQSSDDVRLEDAGVAVVGASSNASR